MLIVPHHLHPVGIWTIFYCLLFILYYSFMKLFCSLSLPVFVMPLAQPYLQGTWHPGSGFCQTVRHHRSIQYGDIIFGGRKKKKKGSPAVLVPTFIISTRLTLWAFLWSIFFFLGCSAARHHPALTSPRPSRPSVLHAARWKQPADQTDLG